ncbi:RNase adapter RapZ [Pararhodospirillum photometricum]|uniref:UPF0042 nucleotide-binding protein Rru_A3448 n=1 Tax=Pararhodospirillum photometricum DSM 122 TaxID=1150469 RepID=H6SNN8_PARPM|nr:RNase adapter RapZ [Pararhodospirillum photometricum]CCG09369.1 UPF0042 nucleotide-binding protein Rru_A3448 [Pararhodospirillum photometricum DSM 122]
MPPRSSQPDPLQTRRRVVVVTGLSGAGRSTVLRALEDMGYEAIDNLPLRLLDPLLDPPAPGALALGLDCRTQGFDVATVVQALDRLEADTSLEVRLIFVDCDDEILVHRYAETRRRHPLALDRPLPDGIALERQLVAPLRPRAFRTLDTTDTPPGRLKALLENDFALDARSDMIVIVTSFGFRHGVPREADLVLDVRFLDNPHYDSTLRPLTGRDPGVGAFIERDPDWHEFFARTTSLFNLLVPRYQREGKSSLTLAIGCTGGHHRSVYTAERLAAWLTEAGVRTRLSHRDLGR